MNVIFPEGLIVREPSSKAPDFIIGTVGVHADRFKEWAEQHKNAKGWVFMTMKKSQKGGYYAQLDTWKPDQEQASPNAPEPTVDVSDPGSEIPF